jgi:hypothetical protein
MPSWLLQRGCLHRADAWKADGSAHVAGHIKDKTARALTLTLASAHTVGEPKTVVAGIGAGHLSMGASDHAFSGHFLLQHKWTGSIQHGCGGGCAAYAPIWVSARYRA